MCTAMGPELLGQNMGPELLGRLNRPGLRWGAFLPLCPKPMFCPETRASVRFKKGYAVIDGTGSHQNGKL